MKNISTAVVAFALISVCFMQTARSQDTGTAYIVTYFETVPSAATKARDLMRALARQSRKEDGNVRFEALQRIGQPNQFAIIETWKDKDAQGAHGSAAHTTRFREALTSLLRSPYDERPHTALSVAAQAAAAKGNTAVRGIYAVTHVDVIPTEKEKGIGLVKELAEGSRGDPGNLRFDALQQNSRPNHMTVVELWRDQRAVDAHGALEHTRQFREKLTPLSGSLYDERLYKLVN